MTPYARARKLLAGRPGAVFRAKVLGVIHSLLLLGLLGLAGLLVALVATGGSATVPDAIHPALPSWVDDKVVGTVPGGVIVENAGLFALVPGNFRSRNPVHEVAASLLIGLLNNLPNLRSNVGSLTLLTCLALVGLLLLDLVTRLRSRAIASATGEVGASLRRQIHRQMYRLGQSSLPTEGTGPVVNLFTREVNDVRDGLATQLDVEARMPVLAVGLAAFLLLVSWRSTLFFAALGTLVYLASRALRRSGEDRAVHATRASGVGLSALQEDLGLLRLVRVHAMENVDKARFDDHLDDYTESESRRAVAESDGASTLILLAAAAAVASLGFLAYGVVVHRHTPGSAFFLIASLAGLVAPAFAWVRMRRSVEVANRSANGIFGYLERSPELQQAGGAKFLPPLHQKISFVDVTLENSLGRRLLNDLTVDIPAGSRVAIMGADDDAKYAMVCLIPRLIDPKLGRVEIDGIDLRDVTLESARAQVSTVLQADLVFSDTVFANIAMGDPRFDINKVMEAAKLAHAQKFIRDLPEGYETPIGPLGHFLTPDQQYRIGLARAILHDPSIVIVEEPHTVDDEVKPLLDDTLARLAPGRTLILLPHRLSTIRSCDLVIVLQGGRLESVGPPKHVHGASKLYRHLQYLEFNQFATGEVEAGQIASE